MSSASRFTEFSGWELQILARGVTAQQGATQRAEQETARTRLLDEIHEEFEQRENLGLSDPEAAR